MSARRPTRPTIIVVHPREKRRKCTVEPLRTDPGFVFHTFPDVPTLPPGYVRLGLGGPELSRADADAGLLVLDGTWHLAARMESMFSAVPVRTLPFWTTAYPRVSKTFEDPWSGLATIEAVFAAYATLGYDTAGLLDHYHWGPEFLERNAARLQALG